MIGHANLVDEITKELQENSTGYQKIWSNTTMGCLLWMDDVVLIHHDKEEIQKMLSITNEIAKRYHIKFGKEKSQILTIGNTEVTLNLKLWNETIDPTTTNKYLGMTVNGKGNLEAHLNAVWKK